MPSAHRWKLDTTWDDVPTKEYDGGIRVAFYSVGEQGAPGAPTVLRVQAPPGARVAPHSHACDYTEIVLEGSERVSRRWHREGDILVRTAGTVYGPLVAGPEGVTKLVFFADDRVLAIAPNAPVPPAAELRI
jgi:hypothetical protein